MNEGDHSGDIKSPFHWVEVNKMRQQIICNHDYRRLDCLHMNICVEVILLNKWLANTVQEKTFKTLVPLNTGPCLSR